MGVKIQIILRTLFIQNYRMFHFFLSLTTPLIQKIYVNVVKF